MDKLTFYALSSPEKLDRIGQYLEQRLNKEVKWRRVEFVFIAMDALDQLLVSCHAQSLNLFVESFLKMVQKLLECEEPELQILATASFVKFANIEEDTPSYHRRYDFFVSKFSSMSHSGLQKQETRTKIRRAGLHGLQGLVRKTVSDDLQVNIWDPVHMDKIVPSLLFNMHDPSLYEEHPSFIAETVFRDLICRASYGCIKSVVKPVLIHMDNHSLWVPNQFAVKCFKIIMYSVQAQYGYIVISSLLDHLDEHVKTDPSIKSSIVSVLFQAVLISAGGSIGPSVLEVFNILLRHLRISVDNKSQNTELRNKEIEFEDEVINTIAFANNLPDYQKIEIMMFVMGKFPQFSSDEDTCAMDTQLQMNLLRTLLKVATKYETVTFSNAFPPEFLHPLLRMSLLDDSLMRVTVQNILQTLIDRHDNTQKLKPVRIPGDISKLNLTIEKSSRQDILFMKKSGMQFYWHIYENMQMTSNRVDNFEALYCTMCLLAVELGDGEILIELFRLALDIQQMIVTSAGLPLTHKCAIHGLIAAYMNLLTHLTDIPSLAEYISQVIELRREQYLFDQNKIAECFSNSGHDTIRLSSSFIQKPYSADHDFNVREKQKYNEEITVESLKQMLAEDNIVNKELEDKKRLEILETFRSAPFEEIVARSEAKSNHFHNKLNEILDMVVDPVEASEDDVNNATVPVYQMTYPDLFVY
ncbi:hypothetical protein LOTGIDRAFT_166379 [Lottia gigantea]|uniref:Protein EFR3 homolog B n=1 Tax=Lottia gigantea TaxID=225164 RepID=V3ZT24_LOTGI|nr:hypothetical protein LOTGIDRAFT_166379 [Lottia gigantea]ESO87502.1 hypothetical protein LOTGIDRAFT_166379 [Lottia gigantea]